MLTEIHAAVMDLKRGHDATLTAFTTNDLGKPDLDGHRKAHLGMIHAAKVMDTYKTEAVKKVLGYVVAFIIGLVVTGGTDKIRDLVAGKPAAVAAK
ncbi:hypothetical protein [Rhodoferax mekongensis]|uniref:Uncharacterized protein n=1 Tax=Rhodoferax mekongensis TaxID=3068341 RepID=A0ABZ0B2L0_9BURK|nr:hypothetical protein [Rhodoferax sp. TBRC 17307]WNO06056.1 hypothetical protein RAN89_06395 [Rhodoferax sp. TBRC 17307]